MPVTCIKIQPMIKAKTAIVVCLYFLFLQFSQAQCPTGDVYLSKQSEIISFAKDYPGCTDIQGVLYLGDFGFGTDIVDLSPLSGLTSLAGLSLHGTTNLNDLAGLHNVTAINGLISIEKNIELDNLNGLSAVSSLVKSISVIGNPELADLLGLGNAVLEDGDLEVRHNKVMLSLDGLGTVTTGQQITISNNDMMLDISALSSLVKAESVIITDLVALPSLKGLENLNYIGSTLEINNLPILSDLSALTTLGTVEDNLILSKLPLVQNLQGLEALQLAGTLSILHNGKLESLDALQQLTSVDDLQIVDNMLLKNLKGLEQLSELQNLQLNRNIALETVEGLAGVTEIFEGFEISQNLSLLSLKYLNGLTRISGDVEISNNEKLNTLEGFDNAFLAGQSLTISDNKILEVCGVTNVCEFLNTKPTKATISGNGLSCGTVNEVINYCGLFALPVELSSFELSKENTNTKLTWITTSEVNNRGFEILRSVDGEIWEKIAWVTAKGNKESATTYEYIDSPKAVGTVYYRLNQIDQSGIEKESKVNSLNFGYIESNLSVYPNPALDRVTIDYQVADGLVKQGVVVQLLNLTGQLVNICLRQMAFPQF